MVSNFTVLCKCMHKQCTEKEKNHETVTGGTHSGAHQFNGSEIFFFACECPSSLHFRGTNESN